MGKWGGSNKFFFFFCTGNFWQSGDDLAKSFVIHVEEHTSFLKVQVFQITYAWLMHTMRKVGTSSYFYAIFCGFYTFFFFNFCGLCSWTSPPLGCSNVESFESL
jgi:hypothetical protein